MTNAKSLWERLNSKRSGVLNRARDSAALTIPSLMPPEGSDENTDLPTPYQSLGARGVNNLASKMVLALLPPNTPFFRLQLDDEVRAELGASATDIEDGLRRIENKLMRRIESGNLRVMLHAAFKHLIVTGNALLYLPMSGQARMFRLNQYVVVRDAAGNVIDMVVKESVDPVTLTEEVRAACGVELPEQAEAEDRDVDVYTRVQRTDNDIVEYWQEINETKVPGSEGRNKADESPWIVMRWQAVENEAYGRGLVEEYSGDLRSLEGLSKSIVGFSAIASKILLLLHPNSTTDEDDLVNAESGDVITGNKADIDVLQLDKYHDFQVAKNVIDDLTLRLSHAFLLQSGTVRDAERVTAEEIRAQAQELEDVLGGVYTVQAQETQLPLVRRLMFIEKQAGGIPRLPKGAFSPTIITGFDALGRGHELNRLRAFLSDAVALFGPMAQQYVDTGKGMKVLATAYNVDVEDILKSDEQVAQEQEQAQASQMALNAAGPAAGAAVNGIMKQGT